MKTIAKIATSTYFVQRNECFFELLYSIRIIFLLGKIFLENFSGREGVTFYCARFFLLDCIKMFIFAF